MAPPPASGGGKTGLLIAIIAVVLVVILGCGAWWFISNMTMSEEDYETEAGAIVEDIVDLTMDLQDSSEPEDIEEARDIIRGWADTAGDLKGRLEKLNPPETYEDTHADLLEVVVVYEEFFEKFADAADESDDMDQLAEKSESVLTDAQSEKFYNAGETLFSVAVGLGLDVEEIFGPLGIEGF
ncbi:MAG: hypothetical protein OEV43_02330 [Coriobacteriia bacterium]|nr:hypothetical protein [Coriobacteriia bacterium]